MVVFRKGAMRVPFEGISQLRIRLVGHRGLSWAFRIIALDTRLFSQEGRLTAQSVCYYSDAFPGAEVPELVRCKIWMRSEVDVQFVLGFCGKGKRRTQLD